MHRAAESLEIPGNWESGIKFSDVYAGLSLVASCLLWKGMTCQKKGGVCYE
jgi:hypothetical protein